MKVLVRVTIRVRVRDRVRVSQHFHILDTPYMSHLPISLWISEGANFKFFGDNVDKKKGTRDIRSDCQGEMKHV